MICISATCLFLLLQQVMGMLSSGNMLLQQLCVNVDYTHPQHAHSGDVLQALPAEDTFALQQGSVEDMTERTMT